MRPVWRRCATKRSLPSNRSSRRNRGLRPRWRPLSTLLDATGWADYASRRLWRQAMKKFLAISSLLLASVATPAQNNPAAQAVIRPGENLVLENLPPVPASVAEKANQYGEYREARLQDWDPVKREMLVVTRFADVPQIHRVKMPGGDRN